MAKYRILFLLFAILTMTSAFSQTDGYMTHYRQYEPSLQDGRYSVNDFCSFPQFDDKTIFANLLLWTVDNVCQSQFLGIEEKDFDKLQLSFPVTIKSATIEKASYDMRVAFKVGEGRLIFNITSIQYHSGALLMGSGAKLEKYKNKEKESNRNVISDFIKSESAFMNAIFNFMESHNVPVSRWDAMRTGRPVKGMDEEECKCTMGKPSSVSSDGQETQWVIGTSKYVFFKNGVITNVVF